MNLHNNRKAFEQAIQYTADKLHISPVFIEKDYWVTFALYTISNNNIGRDTIFKGGTALSKCYKLIEYVKNRKFLISHVWHIPQTLNRYYFRGKVFLYFL